MKIKKHISIMLALVVFCQSCKEVSQSVPTINLTSLSQSNAVNISNYIENISYSPLQTTEKNLIDYVHKAIFTDSYILINTSYADLYCFDSSGLFIRKIGNMGKGPGEYDRIIDFAYNEHQKNVFILSSKRVYVFSIEGDFQNSFEITDLASATIESIDDWIVIHNNNDIGNTSNSFSIYHKNGQLYKNVANPHLFKVKKGICSWDHECLFYKVNNHLYLKELHSDTVFMFSPETFTPTWYFNTEGHGIKPEVRVSKEFFMNPTSCLSFIQLAGTKESLFSLYVYKRTMYLSVFTNTTNNRASTFQLGNEKVNSIDGGIPVNPACFLNRDGIEYLAQFCLPFELKAHIASEAFKNSTPLNPEKKKALEQLANSLNETDNPVLMLVKLKE